jgi:hypothetical protein
LRQAQTSLFLLLCIFPLVIYAQTPLNVFKSSIHSRAVGNTNLGSDIKIGTVNNSNMRILGGCGCYFQIPSVRRKSQSYVFLADLGSSIGKRAWMNINGRDTVLRLVSSTRRSRRETKGSSFTETYRSGELTARVTYVVTKPNPSGGEVSKYSATITVSNANSKQTIKVPGECGC